MTILLFLVDTSASMAQKNYQGISYLDTAKALVADLIKQRQRDQQARGGDRYMLLSTEDFPLCVKTGWREGNAILTEQLKALKTGGRNTLKTGIINAFQFINSNRANSGIDNYGLGRFPFYLEPAIIIIISDACSCTDLPADFELRVRPDSSKPSTGSELTEELFRWDQKLFSVVLRMPAQLPKLDAYNRIDADAEVVQRVCASTGGRSFNVQTHRQLPFVVEQLVQSISITGVFLRFELPHIVPEIPNGGHAMELDRASEEAIEMLRKKIDQRPLTLIFTRTQKQMLHWPVPEAFWPESIQQKPTLPPRRAHPVISISSYPVDALVVPEFPFDKYEIESCALTEYILEKSATATNICWQVFVYNSWRIPGLGKPFGYLKAATNLQSVNLFIMAYNYPVILQLIEEQKVDIRVRNAPEWKKKLDRYMESCPAYYLAPVKKALGRLKITSGVMEEPSATAVYPFPILSMLGKIKQNGKEEFEARCAEIGIRLRQPLQPPSMLCMICVEKRPKHTKTLNFRCEFEQKKEKEREKATKERRKNRGPIPLVTATTPLEEELPPDPELVVSLGATVDTYPNYQIDIGSCSIHPPSSQLENAFRNPFNIDRQHLVSMAPQLRMNMRHHLTENKISALEGGLPGTFCTLQNAYELHSLPIQKMGNYEEYVSSLEAIGKGTMREVEPRAVREHAFGNPFKKDKKSLAVDEVGEAPPTTSKEKKDKQVPNTGRPPKRKAGPLAANSLMNWRENRRTRSMASSVMSDVSHLSDDIDEQPLAIAEEEPPEDPTMDNVVETMSSGWGLEDEADDDEIKIISVEPPPVKKVKTENNVHKTELGEDELFTKKKSISAQVRRVDRDSTILPDIRSILEVAPSSREALLAYAIGEAARFKRRQLLSSLRQLANGMPANDHRS